MTRLVQLFIEKLPKGQHVLGLYAVIVFFIYSWTLFTSFYALPAWVFYLTTGEILSVYAYAFSMSFVDSSFVLLGVLFLDFTLFFFLKNRDEFLPRSIGTAIVFLISSMWRLFFFQGSEDSAAFIGGETQWWILTVVIGLPFAMLISKNHGLRRILEGLAERTIIFLYIYLPLSLISLMIVLIRNIN